jgi:hypothetical protein
MNTVSESGKRNLRILVWMGLACQVFGVLIVIGDLANLMLGSASGGLVLLRGPVMLTFGIALGGWAGLLGEIVELNEHVAELEGGAATPAATANNQ